MSTVWLLRIYIRDTEGGLDRRADGTARTRDAAAERRDRERARDTAAYCSTLNTRHSC